MVSTKHETKTISGTEKETESENKNSLTIKIQNRMKTTVKTVAGWVTTDCLNPICALPKWNK